MDIGKNYGAFLEKDGAGFRGQVKLTGLSNGDIDFTNSLWTYQVKVTLAFFIDFSFTLMTWSMHLNLFYIFFLWFRCYSFISVHSCIFILLCSYKDFYIRRINITIILSYELRYGYKKATTSFFLKLKATTLVGHYIKTVLTSCTNVSSSISLSCCPLVW